MQGAEGRGCRSGGPSARCTHRGRRPTVTHPRNAQRGSQRMVNRSTNPPTQPHKNTPTPAHTLPTRRIAAGPPSAAAAGINPPKQDPPATRFAHHHPHPPAPPPQTHPHDIYGRVADGPRQQVLQQVAGLDAPELHVCAGVGRGRRQQEGLVGAWGRLQGLKMPLPLHKQHAGTSSPADTTPTRKPGSPPAPPPTHSSTRLCSSAHPPKQAAAPTQAHTTHTHTHRDTHHHHHTHISARPPAHPPAYL